MGPQSSRLRAGPLPVELAACTHRGGGEVAGARRVRRGGGCSAHPGWTSAGSAGRRYHRGARRLIVSLQLAAVASILARDAGVVGLYCPAGSYEDHAGACLHCPAGKFHPWNITDCKCRKREGSVRVRARALRARVRSRMHTHTCIPCWSLALLNGSAATNARRKFGQEL